MMNIYKQKKINEVKKKALVLYKQGLTLREISKIINKSHEWARQAIMELSTDENLIKNDKEI